jgi:pyrimidine-nucleoside phosphorylase
MLLPAQIIQKKRDGGALTEEEIEFFVDGFTNGQLPDYQMSALAMAICFQGMNFDETMWLTRAMVESGEVVQWPAGHFHADKHSTGGIGDKTSIILAPLVAACGVRVPMISGRGLGPTGGTLDKLESIPGFRTQLPLAEFQFITGAVGCCMIGATPEIAPADKKLYALRDVTATVSCLPLIVASIMSKKLAENVDALVLDVKWGSGAFMKTRESSRNLARAMVEVGKLYGKKVVALQSDMNQPLGRCIGNSLEIQECIEVMSGRQPAGDLTELTLALGAEMIFFAGTVKSIAAGKEMLQKKLTNGEALEKFHEMVTAQGGQARSLPVARQTRPVLAQQSGYVQAIACDQLGYAVIAMGGGRRVATDTIDPTVGYENPRKIGDAIRAGEPLMTMHYNDSSAGAAAEEMARNAYTIAPEPVSVLPQLITEKIE